MLSCFEDVKDQDGMMKALEEIDGYVTEAIYMISTANDPTVGYHKGIDLIQIAFDDLPCKAIESWLEKLLFNMLRQRIHLMMDELEELRCEKEQGE